MNGINSKSNKQEGFVNKEAQFVFNYLINICKIISIDHFHLQTICGVSSQNVAYHNSHIKYSRYTVSSISSINLKFRIWQITSEAFRRFPWNIPVTYIDPFYHKLYVDVYIDVIICLSLFHPC